MHAAPHASPHLRALSAACRALCPAGLVAVAVDATGDPATDLHHARTLLWQGCVRLSEADGVERWPLFHAGLDALTAMSANPCARERL